MGSKADLVGADCQVLPLHKAVTTAASVLVMERKYPLYVLENVQTTGLSTGRGREPPHILDTDSESMYLVRFTLPVVCFKEATRATYV